MRTLEKRGRVIPYEEFLKTTKVAMAEVSGFPCDSSEVHDSRLPHQADVTAWGVRGGRRAYFLAPGLGKTGIQLETLRLILEKSQGERALVVIPLNVRREFLKDAPGLGIQVAFCQTTEQVLKSDAKIILTNYESVRENKIDLTLFTAVSLDEAAILRSFGSKTFGEFLFGDMMNIPYRFVATATPALKDFLKLIAYAHFLGIMEMGQAKTRFFQRNSEKADDLTLIPHMEEAFWLWVGSWACMLQLPSDLGYQDTGYTMPPLDIRWHEIESDQSDIQPDKRGQRALMKDTKIGVSEASKEKRSSLDGRIRKLLEIRAEDTAAHRVIWHHLEDERRAIEAAIPTIKSIYGDLPLEEREQIITDFAEGRIQEISTKPQINGSGCNIQEHCSWAIYLGIDFKATDFIQSLYRLWRFLQKNQVRVDLIYTEAQRGIREELERQWNQHQFMTSKQAEILREYGLHRNPAPIVARKLVTERQEEKTELYWANCGDSIPHTASLPDNSVDLIHSSYPFGNQYEYGEYLNDLGHTDNLEHFFRQLDYLTPDLLRVIAPGRVCAIHVKDRIMPGAMTGEHFQTVEPFHCKVIEHMTRHGFHYGGMITVVTDVVRENNQTYRLGMTEMCKDGSKMSVGLPEYILLFRKAPTSTENGYADKRVTKDSREYRLSRWQLDAHAFWRSNGNRFITADDFEGMDLGQTYRFFRQYSYAMPYSFEQHCEIAQVLEDRGEVPGARKLIRKDFMVLPPQSSHPDVWTDITRMVTLNTRQSAANKVKHICPLQTDLVKRIIERFTNPGEVVYDPFAGLGTVPTMAVELGRIGWGSELNETYYKDSLYYLRQAAVKAKSPTLFDALEIQEEEGLPSEVA